MATASFDGGTYELSEIQAPPAHVARRLERARVTAGHALCHCRTDAPRNLVTSRYSSLYHLAGWPDDGPLHAEKCDFRKTPRYGNDRSSDTHNTHNNYPKRGERHDHAWPILASE